METQELFVYPNRKTILLMFISGIVMFPIGAFLLYKSLIFWGLVFSLAGLFNILYNIQYLFSKNPILIINKAGITDRMNMPGNGFISWKNIEGIYIDDIAGFSNILVILKDPDAHISQQSFWKRPFMRSNAKNYGTHILFRTSIMPQPGEKVLSVLNYYLEQEGKIGILRSNKIPLSKDT